MHPAQDPRLSTAPMMDWTDRHCRYLFRQIAPKALIYTEMVTTGAIIHGDAQRFLDHDAREHPLALQLGGSEPRDLYRAVEIAKPFGFCEYNLNCGCPSERVQKGAFGASLMAEPELVAECVTAMREASDRPITVKCRIGIDDQPVPDMLILFVEKLRAAGVRRMIIHARKAWLKGLSPKHNREVPPLEYAVVYGIKRLFPDLEIIINGGITDVDEALGHMQAGMDGVMLGRHAYHQPMELTRFSKALFADGQAAPTLTEVLASMRSYAEAMKIEHETPLIHITRHMLGLAHGLPGARRFRRLLSEDARQPDASANLIDLAADELSNRKLVA